MRENRWVLEGLDFSARSNRDSCYRGKPHAHHLYAVSKPLLGIQMIAHAPKVALSCPFMIGSV
jgi:hypothetical protein